MRTFNPFEFDWRTLENLFRNAGQDIYSGVWWHRDMIAFWMLRGIDDGKSIPEFGVLVDEKYGNMGIGSLCIDMAKLTAKLLGLSAIYLTCYPQNVRAVRLYKRHGFVYTAQTNEMVYMRWTT